MSQTGPGGGATSSRRLWESGGEAPSRWAIFCKFLEKNGYFKAIWITFRTFSEPFERTKFLRFESQLNEFLLFLQVKSKTHLKSFILGLNFVTWPGQENQDTYTVAFCNLFGIKSFTRRFAFEDFYFVKKITSFRNTYDQEPKHSRFNFNNLFNKHFPKLILFKSILSLEN